VLIRLTSLVVEQWNRGSFFKPKTLSPFTVGDTLPGDINISLRYLTVNAMTETVAAAAEEDEEEGGGGWVSQR